LQAQVVRLRRTNLGYPIELDDRSHERADVQQRDRFKNAAFQSAQLPLIRLQTQPAWDVEQLRRQFLPRLQDRSRIVYATPVEADEPVCPRCGVPMLLRRAKRGKQQGSEFYGCANFPRCREIQAID
jgi:hypothetical protein